MTSYLLFANESDAITAQYVISQNMGFPIVGTDLQGNPLPENQWTTQWATPLETLAGSWVFPMPDESFMTNVVNYTISDYDPYWFRG